MTALSEIRLTQYAHGAGCGCKIAPTVLQEILKSTTPHYQDKNILVGNSTNDDAAVYDLGNGSALIATTDFFTPIVDDAFTFGKIAAANAISDVYAMGGEPIMAIAQLGWPIEALPIAAAQQVLEGARTICDEAGIALAGGHSIDSKEPFFGLTVNGMVAQSHLKQNKTAQQGDAIFITKPLGIGVLSTAQKRGVISHDDYDLFIHYTTQLNKLGPLLAALEGVTAMTDVTGFGLLGHLIEMASGAGLSAELNYKAIPIIPSVRSYLTQRMVPDATYRNWNSYSAVTGFESGVNVMEAFNILPDPQTNGGLLFTANQDAIPAVQALLKANDLEAFVQPIGVMTARSDKTIFVKN